MRGLQQPEGQLLLVETGSISTDKRPGPVWLSVPPLQNKSTMTLNHCYHDITILSRTGCKYIHLPTAQLVQDPRKHKVRDAPVRMLVHSSAIVNMVISKLFSGSAHDIGLLSSPGCTPSHDLCFLALMQSCDPHHTGKQHRAKWCQDSLLTSLLRHTC